MTTGFITDLGYELSVWLRDESYKVLWGKSHSILGYLIIERSEAFNPVTSRVRGSLGIGLLLNKLCLSMPIKEINLINQINF